MNAGRLMDFLAGRIGASDFEAEMHVELHEWKRAHRELGRSARIVLSQSQSKNEIKIEHIRLLIREFLEGRLSAYAAAYIVEALLLGENDFSISEAIRENLEMLSELQRDGELAISTAIHVSKRL